jgi:hypothetical protein
LLSPDNPDYSKFQAIQVRLTDQNPHHVLRFFDVQWERENLLKYIYVIMTNKEVRIAPEPLHVKYRPTHSELSNGQPVLAAGELVFTKENDAWKLITINNGSGHYKPPPISLRVARELIPPILTDQGINCQEVLYCSSLRPDLAIGSGLDAAFAMVSEEDDAEELPTGSHSGAEASQAAPLFVPPSVLNTSSALFGSQGEEPHLAELPTVYEAAIVDDNPLSIPGLTSSSSS